MSETPYLVVARPADDTHTPEQQALNAMPLVKLARSAHAVDTTGRMDCGYDFDFEKAVRKVAQKLKKSITAHGPVTIDVSHCGADVKKAINALMAAKDLKGNPDSIALQKLAISKYTVA